MTNAESETVSLQVVMIGIAEEIFAVDAGMVREIIDPIPTTRVAGAKPFLPAVVNVRGNVIPLADLRVRFGMACKPTTSDTRIVVIEMLIEDSPVVVGIVADKVYEVTEITRANAQQTPRVGMLWKPQFISFLAKWKDEFVIVPDMERILN